MSTQAKGGIRFLIDGMGVAISALDEPYTNKTLSKIKRLRFELKVIDGRLDDLRQEIVADLAARIATAKLTAAKPTTKK